MVIFMSSNKDWYDIAEEEFAFGPFPDDPDEEFDESIYDDPEYDIEDLEYHAGIISRPPPMGVIPSTQQSDLK